MADFWKDEVEDKKEWKDRKSTLRKGIPKTYDTFGETKEADEKYVKEGKTEDEKKTRRDFIDFLVTVNGSAATTVPGASRSYIPPKAFYQRVTAAGLNEGEHQLVESAFNWNALGKGDGAIFGASVRWAMRDHFVAGRELTETVYADDIGYEDLKGDVKVMVESYVKAARAKGDLVGFWAKNANQVVALAGALQLSTGHHWDANNRKPQDALLGALGQRDDVPDDGKRALFYLSVHPLPLTIIEDYRTAAAEVNLPGFSQAVKMRAATVPAGFSVLQVAVAAIEQMKNEKYFSRMARAYNDQFADAYALLAAVKAAPTAHHVNAPEYGVKRIVVADNACLTAKIIGVAYAQSVIKGSLAAAISIVKFAAMNSRQVNRWKTAFVNAVSDADITLDFMLEDSEEEVKSRAPE